MAKGSTVLNINKLSMKQTNVYDSTLFMSRYYIFYVSFSLLRSTAKITNLSSSDTKLSLLCFGFQVPILAYPDPCPFVL